MSLISVRSPALLAGASLLLLGGCANLDGTLDDVLGGEVDTVEFDCDGDRDIRVAFLDGGDRVRLFSGDDDVDLRLVDSRDGGEVRVYEGGNGNVRMIDRGDEIQVRIEGKDNFNNCEADDPRYRRGGGGGAF